MLKTARKQNPKEPGQKEPKELKKHSATIQIQNNITLLQRKTWNALLWNAYDNLSTQDIHSIPVQRLMRLIGYDSKNEAYLKEATLAMMHCIVEWNLLGKDGSPVWGAAVLLASTQIENGICSYGFAPHLRQKLYNPDMYARLDLDLQKRFSSKHSLALWELCADYLGAKRDCGETPWIALADFRKLMGIAKDQYALYKLFSQRVLSPALSEINSVSDFRVTIEFQRKGRKITAIKFKMRRVVVPPEPNVAQAPLFPELDDMPLLVKELKDAGLSTQDALQIWQTGFQFVDDAARPAASGEDEEAVFMRYVREKIHLLKRRQASGKVGNSTGFLREAIKKNYANPEFSQEEKSRKSVEERSIANTRDGQRKQLERQLEALKTARNDAIAKECAAIAASAPEVLETTLPGILKANAPLRQFYKSDQSALENYRASYIIAAMVNQSLEGHAPERIKAVKEHYAAQIADIEEKIAASQ